MFIDAVIATAQKWLGYVEKQSATQLENLTANAGRNNYTIFASQYAAFWKKDLQAQPWCAVFVSVVLRQACQAEIVPHFASCTVGINNFKKGIGGKWITSNPQRGDLIFFSDKTGAPAHVGFVMDVSGRTITTIEGNTASTAGVVANGGCVCKKSYAQSYARILGYGRPAYPAGSTKAPQ